MNTTIKPRLERYLYKKSSIMIAVLLPVIVLLGCETVPINPNDSSPPMVSLKVKGQNGYQEVTSVNYGNNSVQQETDIMCVVEDSQGVKSYEISVSDSTVDHVYCDGTVYSGNYLVKDLPSPAQETLSGSTGKVPTKLSGFLKISGILEAAKPLGVSETCYPANNTKIIVRCRGKNWSSNAANSTTTEYLDVEFLF